MGHLRVVGHELQPIRSLVSRTVDPSPAQGTVVSWRCKNYCGSFALWCFIAEVFSVCYIESFGDRIIRHTKTLSGNAQRYQFEKRLTFTDGVETRATGAKGGSIKTDDLSLLGKRFQPSQGTRAETRAAQS